MKCSGERCRSRVRRLLAFQLLTRRDPQDEGGALVGFALDYYCPAVGLGDLPGYGQTEPRSRCVACLIGPVEALEDQGDLVSGDPDPCV